MPSESSRRRARRANAEVFAGTPFRPAHQHGERAKRKGKRKAALDGESDSSGEKDDFSPLDLLPYELIPSILSLLPPRDLLLLKATSHAFNRLIRSDSLWREVYVNRFVRAASELGADVPDYGAARGEGRLIEWDEQREGTADGDVFALARSCVPGAGGQGWQKEAMHREAMLERFFYSRATTVMHNPHIDIIHHLSLFHNPTSTRKPAPPTPNGKSPSKVIGAKHRQAHRHESAGSGRAPNVVSVGMNAGVAIRGDPLVGRSLLGYLGPGQIPGLDGVDRVPTAVFTAPLNPSCILWGLRSGIVVHSALLNPPPIPGRLTGPSVSSAFDESHTDAVRCIYMPPLPKGKNAEKPLFVSGGEDGRVKLWMLDPASKKGTSSIGGQGELSCIWSSTPINASRESPAEVRDEQRPPGLVDPVVQVRYDPASGLVVAATEGGSVWVWTMLMPRAEGAVAYRVDEGPSGVPMHLEFDLDPRTAGYLDAVPKSEDENPPTVDARITLHNAGESHIHRISVHLRPSGTLSHVETAKLVAPDALPIQCVDTVLDGAGSAIGLEKVLVPADFTIKVVRPGESIPSAELSDDEQNDEATPTGSDNLDSSPATPATHTARDYGQPYIVAGTQDGWILVWLWAQPGRRTPDDEATRVVEPLKRWKISKGAVTKVVASRGLVASGTYDGLLQIWDPLASPPTLLRTLRNRHSAPPAAYPSLDTSASKLYSVNNIVLDTDMVVASIGNQVLGWRAGSQKVKEGGKGWKGQVLGKHAASKSSPAKGFNQNEFKEDIKQTKTELKAEQDEIRAKNERDRLAKEEYAEIGFEDTDEALQYAIMMSREEDKRKEHALSQSTEEREFQQMLDQIAKLEAGEIGAEQSATAGPSGLQSTHSDGNNSSGIMTEEQELQIALEQIQAAEAREAALKEHNA